MISQNGSNMNVESPSMVDGQPRANPGMANQKKRRKFGLLKMAVRLFQPNDRKQGKVVVIKKAAEETAKPAQWEKIVGSMRPLHLQENFQSPTRSIEHDSPALADGLNLSEDNFIGSPCASSPSPSMSSRMSETYTMSSYSSAINLQDLDVPRTPKSRYSSSASLPGLDTPKSRYCSMNNLQDLLKGEEGEDEDEDEVFERITADEHIDSKADEFIAKFYQGMSLERSNNNPRGDRWRL